MGPPTRPAQPSGTLRGLQTHREKEADRQTGRLGRPRARAGRGLTSWSADGPGRGGRAPRRSSANGPPGAPGPFYPAGLGPPTPRAPRRPRPAAPEEAAPRPGLPPALRPSPPPAGRPARVARCQPASVVSWPHRPGKSLGRDAAGGRVEGPVFRGGNWRCRRTIRVPEACAHLPGVLVLSPCLGGRVLCQSG